MFAQCHECEWEYVSDHAYSVFDRATGHNESTDHTVGVQ